MLVRSANEYQFARVQRGADSDRTRSLIKKSKQLVSAAEAGRSTLMAPTLAEIGKVLSVDVRWLVRRRRPETATLPRGQEIPLLSATQIIRAFSGMHKVGEVQRTLFTTCEVSDKAFGFALTDNGMRPALLADDLVVVDPGPTPIPAPVVLSIVVREGGVKLADPVIWFGKYVSIRSKLANPFFACCASRWISDGRSSTPKRRDNYRSCNCIDAQREATGD